MTQKPTLQELYRDLRKMYWPIEAYIHARSIYAKNCLIDGTWSAGTTERLVSHWPSVPEVN